MSTPGFGELSSFSSRLLLHTVDFDDIAGHASSVNPQKIQTATQQMRNTLREIESRMAESRLQGTSTKLQGRAEEWSKFMENVITLEAAVGKLNTVRPGIKDLEKIGQVFGRIKNKAQEIEKANLAALSAIEQKQHAADAHMDRQVAITKLLQHEFSDLSCGGCTLAVVEDGAVKFEYATGMADWERNIPMSPGLPQHFGSVSKHVTSMCIARLLQEGKLKLEDPIHKYLPLPPFRFKDKEFTLTIDDLLQMRSGLFDVVNVARVLGEDQELSMDEKLFWIAEVQDLLFKPNDTGRQYCDANHYLLTQVVEQITQQHFTDYAKEMFASLGMHQTTFVDPRKSFDEQTYKNKMVKGYTVDRQTSRLVTAGESQKPIESTTHNLTVGPCGVVGSLNDFTRGWINYLTQFQSQTGFFSTPDVGDGYRYARGLWTNECSGYRVLRHSGGIEGYRTEFLWLHKDGAGATPPKDVAVVWLSNMGSKGGEAEDMVNEIASIWTGEQIAFPRPPPPGPKEKIAVMELDKEEMSIVQREYRCDQSRLKSTYRLEQGTNEEGISGFYLKRTGGKFASEPVFMIPVNKDDSSISFELQGPYRGQVLYDKKSKQFSLAIPDRIAQPLSYHPIAVP